MKHSKKILGLLMALTVAGLILLVNKAVEYHGRQQDIQNKLYESKVRTEQIWKAISASEPQLAQDYNHQTSETLRMQREFDKNSGFETLIGIVLILGAVVFFILGLLMNVAMQLSTR